MIVLGGFSPGAADGSCQRSPPCGRNKFASVCWQDRREGNRILPAYLRLLLPLDVAACAPCSVMPRGTAKGVLPLSWLLFRGGLVHVALRSAGSFTIPATKRWVYNPASKITAAPSAFQAGSLAQEQVHHHPASPPAASTLPFIFISSSLGYFFYFFSFPPGI